jgi:hypothetical protein
MNSTDGLALFLGLLLLAGSISFVYRWSKGSVNDAQGLFGVAGIAVALVFPAFIAPDLYKELFVGLRYLVVVPVGTAAAAVPLAAGEGIQQTADAAAVKVEGLWGKFTRGVGNMFRGWDEAIPGLEGGKRRLKKRV